MKQQSQPRKPQINFSAPAEDLQKFAEICAQEVRDPSAEFVFLVRNEHARIFNRRVVAVKGADGLLKIDQSFVEPPVHQEQISTEEAAA